jgi:rhamnose utilization protein RhaD (predicted bifunctional aldolase and dehydrogenase)/NAD(P)-dependent dehydrogenase (short-subunit alcohol dehydrogenase family)
MENRWSDEDAAEYAADPVAMRAYTSRLLGSDADLVLHGGGNTSVKVDLPNAFGEPERVLYVKGSGWDLAAMQPAGFAPLLLEPVRRLTKLPELADADMMRALRSASRDPDAPAPSVETITHATVPHRFVDHTHADAIVTLSNTPDGEERLRKLYGESVLIVPYAMPGFVLAKLIDSLTKGADWDNLRGLVLMNHGVFSFSDDAHASYDMMIELVAEAEHHLAQSVVRGPARAAAAPLDTLALAGLRKSVSTSLGAPVIAVTDQSPEAAGFAERSDAVELTGRGCLTPDHVLHTKPSPLLFTGAPEDDVARFVAAYGDYFDRNGSTDLARLDPAPRWAVWPGTGLVSLGASPARARVIGDIVRHSVRAAQLAEEIGGWRPVAERDLFDVEYWDLEQAKLRRGGAPPPLQGKIAVVTGAASGIGWACAEALMAQGAAVAAWDLNADVAELSSAPGYLGVACNVTDSDAVDAAVRATLERFGGIDILVSNAGTFPPSAQIADIEDAAWDASINVNLSGHLRVMRAVVPYMRLGIDPAVVVIASKNVPAPGPGAAAYSAAKAGLTQLARVAALELGGDGIRVNVLHPNAVFDTGIWDEATLAGRAKAYGLTVDEYKRNNVMGVEVRAADVAALACALVSPVFAKTTGAQIPVDGGNERVI